MAYRRMFPAPYPILMALSSIGGVGHYLHIILQPGGKSREPTMPVPEDWVWSCVIIGR